MAFTRAARRTLLERAGYRSEYSGKADRPLEAAHKNHKRGEGYNFISNGQMLTLDEHFYQHLSYRGYYQYCEDEHSLLPNGLTIKQNEWAITSLWQRAQGWILLDQERWERRWIES